LRWTYVHFVTARCRHYICGLAVHNYRQQLWRSDFPALQMMNEVNLMRMCLAPCNREQDARFELHVDTNCWINARDCDDCFMVGRSCCCYAAAES
jgi:hypothetical protein